MLPRIRNALKAGVSVPDMDFDAFYPVPVRVVSSQFWTPVEVAIRAAELLVVDHTTRVLDVGSGAGKLCVIGALTTGASFTGIEHRLHLVDVAREHATRMQAAGAKFIHGRFHFLSWTEFDAVYFYNPFHENLYPLSERLDDTVEVSRARSRLDIELAQGLLAAARVGTRAVTYHGFGGRMPKGYTLLSSEQCGSDRLQLWLKTYNARHNPWASHN